MGTNKQGNLYVAIGHGNYGSDPGACANGTTEYKECLRIGQHVTGYTDIKLVPINLSLKERIQWVRKNLTPLDTLIELHMNAAAPAAQGSDIFYRTEDKNAGQLAQRILHMYCRESGIKERLVIGDTNSRHGRLGIIRDVQCQSFLIELGFLTNENDLNSVRAKAERALLTTLTDLFTIPLHTMKEEVPQWMQDACTWVKENDLSNGERPLETITRGEAFELLRKFTSFIKK